MANTQPAYEKQTVTPMFESVEKVHQKPIGFEFEEINYLVDFEAYNIGWILLPDGRTIAAKGWLETIYPPFPLQLYVVTHKKNAVAAKIDTRERKLVTKIQK